MLAILILRDPKSKSLQWLRIGCCQFDGQPLQSLKSHGQKVGGIMSFIGTIGKTGIWAYHALPQFVQPHIVQKANSVWTSKSGCDNCSPMFIGHSNVPAPGTSVWHTKILLQKLQGSRLSMHGDFPTVVCLQPSKIVYVPCTMEHVMHMPSGTSFQQ